MRTDQPDPRRSPRHARTDAVDAVRGKQGEPGESLKERAAYLYGLVITGSVLASAPADLGIVRVAGLLGGTLLVYWCAESYAHLIAARSLARRPLRPAERRHVLAEGLPLIAACTAPVVVLLIEWVLRVPADVAVDVALVVNLGLLLVVGWRMSTDGGLRGSRRLGATATAGLLGVAMIGLKLALH
ncbi:hypothetical protein [Promicromonospora sukumoe]|uniref:hypothetical protein n=1 Tax=Promicromonospora sukumoe TaxID=88382 RepID=UPI003663DE5C